MPDYPFAGGIADVPAFGQEEKIRFYGTWLDGDTWTIPFVSTLTGNFTLGKGNIAGRAISTAFKLRRRMYLGLGTDFALSSVGDVTKWEEQNIGAAVIPFLSQFGGQDTVQAFASLQGRLVVFGTTSSQIWSIDADPAQMVLLQVLDNTGTLAPLSVKSIGDIDVMYLDYSGVRSMRSKEVTLNASPNDIGTAIDLLIRTALETYDGDTTPACAIVEPTTKQYWLFLNDTIYVLANYPQSKITAWSTYKPTVETTITAVTDPYSGGGATSYTGLTVGRTYHWTKGANDTSITCGATTLTATGSFVATATTATGAGSAGLALTSTLLEVNTPFAPEKFVVSNSRVYCRGADGKVYRYGGASNNTFDHSQATVTLPWLDHKKPSTEKQAMSVDAAFSGNWEILGSMDPRASSLISLMSRGSISSPDMTEDSTYDVGRFTMPGVGTHFKLKAVSGVEATAAKLGKITFLYNDANTK